MRWFVLAVPLLAGCARLDSTMMLAGGEVRIEPHPTIPAAKRVAVLAYPNSGDWSSPVSPNTPRGRARLVAELLGPQCVATEEAAIPLAPGPLGNARAQIVLRVECP